MFESQFLDWKEQRERLVVKRVLEAGLGFLPENVSKIVAEMSYKIQSKKNPRDCPCYSIGPCHPNADDMNCFFCACPNFLINYDKKRNLLGDCAVDSNHALRAKFSSPAVLDCSSCLLPHDPVVAEIYLRENLHRYASLASEKK